MMRIWLKEDKLPQKLCVKFSTEINKNIDDIYDNNQNNIDALKKWFDYIDGIKNYISNPVIAYDYTHKYPHLRNGAICLA